MSGYRFFKIFFALQFCILFSIPKMGFADEFLEALHVAWRESKVQSVYYSDLIEYLDQDNQALWRSGHKGVYPGLPSGAFSSPSQAFLMAQESILFWKSAEFQLDQLIRFYSGLPSGAYKTAPVQRLLFEVISEFSQSATVAFFDLHSAIKVLRRFYHTHRDRSGYAPDPLVTQALLDAVDASFDQIYATMKSKMGIQPHWKISGLRPLKSLLVSLPSSLLLDQYYFDFNQSVHLTKFLLQFYLGAPTDLKEIEAHDQEDLRWVRVIANHFNASDQMMLASLFGVSRCVNKDTVLLSPADLAPLDQKLKRSIIARSLSLALTKKSEISAELASERSSLAASATVSSSLSGALARVNVGASSGGAKASLSVKPVDGAAAESPGCKGMGGGSARSGMAPLRKAHAVGDKATECGAASAAKAGSEAKKGVALPASTMCHSLKHAEVDALLSSGLADGVVGGGRGLADDVALGPVLASCAGLKSAVAEEEVLKITSAKAVSLGGLLRESEVEDLRCAGGFFADSSSCGAGGARGPFNSGGLATAAAATVSRADELDSAADDYDYVRELLEEHHRYQAMKAHRRSPPAVLGAEEERSSAEDGASVMGGARSSPVAAIESSTAFSRIILTGAAAQTYRTVMGHQSTEIRNREVHDLVRALGGRLDFSLNDPRIVIPNRSDGATGPELIFKLHFRHSGRESFPLGTLRRFFGSAIERAGLAPYIELN